MNSGSGPARGAVRRYWLRHRQHLGVAGAIFLNGDAHAPLSRDGLHRITTTLGNQADVSPCNPHRFRHSAAVAAIRAGMGLFEVQLMLGHSDLTMTRHYAKLAGEDLARASQQHSALDHLKLNL